MLTLTDVVKGYPVAGTMQRVLDGVCLQLHSGDSCVVTGPSGSGKSTLLNIVGCLDSPDRGQILIDGEDPSLLNDAAAARLRNAAIGFIFQSFHLVPVLTAVENVAYPLFIKGVAKKARLDRARALLDRVGLADFTDRLPARLSGGQRQRVAIARALACGPRMILADEPTANLDRRTATQIMELLAQLNAEEQMILLMATHDQLVMSYAVRQLSLVDGRIVENAEPSHA